MPDVEVCFCACEAFDLWYEEDGHRVCRCGHPASQHIDGSRMCTGDVEVRRGT